MAKANKDTGLKITSRYEKESILYAFIRKEVVDWDCIHDFRDASIQNIKDEKLGVDKINEFKEDPKLFLQEKYQNIDVQDFKDIVKHIEEFYANGISEFKGLRYYQYITLFITYVFCKLHTKDSFKEEYLSFIAGNVIDGLWNYSHNLDSSFNRLGYWMATASGKTIMMYAIAYMYVKLFSKDIRTLYILVPSDELRTQHAKFLEMFGGMTGGSDSVIMINGMQLFGDYDINVRLTTIKKMLDDEDGRNLDNNSIMIFDEAHRGADNDDAATEKLKKRFIEKNNSFLFEFSATFQKAFLNDNKNINDVLIKEKNIFDRYIFSSIMKYNLYDFNSDGFGKCYYVNNLIGSDDKTDDGKRKLVCDSLVHLGLQLFAYETIKEENPEFTDKGTYLQHTDGTKIYYPLYMGLSWSLLKKQSGKETIDEKAGTSLVDILEHIGYIFAHYDKYYDYIDEKIGALYQDELKVNQGRANPERIFELLTGIKYTEGIYVGLNLWYDKQADEIKIVLGNKKMLINTGSNSKVAEFLQKSIPSLFSFDEKFGIGGRWFTNIDNDKDVLYVFGSKKFIEGWDSKRPSTIMLFKMGKSSTIQATQILGRGLRLAGKDGDGYRHISERIKHRPNGDNHHTFLTEFVGLFGYEIDEFKKFIDDISGDVISITIHKSRTYTPSFISYLDSKGIDYTNDDKVDNFLKETFKYKYQTIDKTTNTIENTKLVVDTEDKGLIKFYLSWDGGRKNVGSLKQKDNKLMSTREVGSIVAGKGVLGVAVVGVTYSYLGIDTLGELGISKFIRKMKGEYNPSWDLDNKTWEDIQELVRHLTLHTDYVSSEQVDGLDNRFDLDLQNKIIKIFLDFLKNLFSTIDKHITNLKEKEINSHTGDLSLNNFIKSLKVTLSIKKTGDEKYKSLLKLFGMDESMHQLEEKYEKLNDNQKKMIDPFLSLKGSDLHFYDRLYYIPKSSDDKRMQRLHQVDDSADVNGMMLDVIGFKSDPIDLGLNYNEEHRVEEILVEISKDSIYSKYDIFYLRNLVGVSNGGINFAYEDENGELKYFFPDFLFWFIDKESKETTLIYFEPKSSVDPNWRLKNELLDNIMKGEQVDDCIRGLFDRASGGNETFWGGMKI